MRRKFLLFCTSILASMAMVHGCTDPTPVPQCEGEECEDEEEGPPSCQTGADCAVGKTCLLNQCVDPPTCQSTDDCPDGECVQGRCLGEKGPANNSNSDSNNATNNGTNNDTTGTNGNSDPGDGPLLFCHSETDEGDDGLIERTIDMEYDADGTKVAEEWRDQEIDNFNFRETFTYDSDGLRIRTDKDIGFDDTVDVRTTYEYDDQNRLSEVREDRDVDGTIDSTTENTYDADGKRIRERIIWPGNEVHRVREFIYDENGYLSEETTDFDDDGIDSRSFYENDEDGRLLETRYDFDNDGTIDMRTVYVYEEGRRIRKEEDEDGDDQVDVVTHYEYGPGGREVVRREETPTGELLSRRTTSYTDMDEGVDVHREYDTDGNGTVDKVGLSNWRYDPACEL